MHNQKMRERQVRRRQMGCTDDLNSSEDDTRVNCSVIAAQRGPVVKLGRERQPSAYHKKKYEVNNTQDCSGWRG